MTLRTASGSRRIEWPPISRVAGGGHEQRREHLQGGRLAGAVRPDQAEDLALLDLEVDAGDGQRCGRSAWSSRSVLRAMRHVFELTESFPRGGRGIGSSVWSSPNWPASVLIHEAELDPRRSRRRSARDWRCGSSSTCSDAGIEPTSRSSRSNSWKSGSGSNGRLRRDIGRSSGFGFAGSPSAGVGVDRRRALGAGRARARARAVGWLGPASASGSSCGGCSSGGSGSNDVARAAQDARLALGQGDLQRGRR